MNKEELKNLSIEELEELVKEANNIIKTRKEKNIEKVVYMHDCFGSANYHLGKYKHWAKVLTDVDTTKENGYAFIGDFILVNSKKTLPIGTLVVETCGSAIRLYKVIEDEKKDLLLESGYKNIIYFIRDTKKILDEVGVDK